MSSVLQRIRAMKEAAASAPTTPTPITPVPVPEPVPVVVEAEPVAKIASDDPEIGPMMDLDKITYMQIAFWDNGAEQIEFINSKGKKSKTRAPRFKLTIEAWTDPAEKISKWHKQMQFKRNVQLRQPLPFQNAILASNVKSKKISEDFSRAAGMVAVNADDNDLFGLIFDRNLGWNYFDHQFVHVRFKDDGVPVVDLHINGQVLTINNFHDKFATGKVASPASSTVAVTRI